MSGVRTGARAPERCCPSIPRPGADGRSLGGFSEGQGRVGFSEGQGRVSKTREEEEWLAKAGSTGRGCPGAPFPGDQMLWNYIVVVTAHVSACIKVYLKVYFK